MARADSTVSVMFSLRSSACSAGEAEGEIRVRARRSTVFGTDLLISLLCVRVCVCVCVCVCVKGVCVCVCVCVCSRASNNMVV